MARRFNPQDFPGLYHRGHEGWHVVVFLLIVAALVGLLVWLILSARRSPAGSVVAPSGPSTPDRALDEARLRYARGETTREQYAQVVTDLGGTPIAFAPPSTPPITSEGGPPA